MYDGYKTLVNNGSIVPIYQEKVEREVLILNDKILMKEIIEQRKLKGSSRKPKYATRKLSIGLVSCML